MKALLALVCLRLLQKKRNIHETSMKPPLHAWGVCDCCTDLSTPFPKLVWVHEPPSSEPKLIAFDVFANFSFTIKNTLVFLLLQGQQSKTSCHRL